MAFVSFSTVFVSVMLFTVSPVAGKTEKTEGDTVEFTPAEFTVSITTMEWTHVDKSSNKIKAIKWDSRDQSLNIPNPRFKKITSIDTKTGKLTIESLTKEHSGQYKFELNGETKGEFSLEVSGEPFKKEEGQEVSFLPKDFAKATQSMIWKHIAGLDTTRVAEWDPKDEPPVTFHGQFRNIASLDETTGQLTIKNLVEEHSGKYTFYVDGVEKETFILVVSKRLPIPTIERDTGNNPNIVYLKCNYDGSGHKDLLIIWSNSTQELRTMKPEEHDKSFIVEKSNNPDNYYTCSLKSPAGRETSLKAYERDLFKESGLGEGAIAGIIISIIILICGGVGAFFYKTNSVFHDLIHDRFSCLRGNAPAPTETNANVNVPLRNSPSSTQPADGD
ncbi:hypothetical protein DNTS_012491 [Danionella cerebrum]|uniref:Ig-like domain-containing protein n=1 Tax=Danionella cerebrum TaxID=2873325 RepID=A0A553R008_9TELE|nr:hypothetical protein DNTS_012491 [Danionella translucida]